MCKHCSLYITAFIRVNCNLPCRKEMELEKNSTVAKNATVQIEGNREITRNIDFYNLDMIISVGYRVNSLRGTQFRIWANKILNEYLVTGYMLNEKRLQSQMKDFDALIAEARLKGKEADLKKSDIVAAIAWNHLPLDGGG